MIEALVVLTNVGDTDVAQQIARRLVEQKLAVCVNILPGVRSIYRWRGAVEEAEEVTLMIKTVRSNYVELEASIKAMHPYEVPEIIALPIAAGLSAYLDWITQETKKDSDV
jgi:periplasmic divalent cation tolerance protein